MNTLKTQVPDEAKKSVDLTTFEKKHVVRGYLVLPQP